MWKQWPIMRSEPAISSLQPRCHTKIVFNDTPTTPQTALGIKGKNKKKTKYLITESKKFIFCKNFFDKNKSFSERLWLWRRNSQWTMKKLLYEVISRTDCWTSLLTPLSDSDQMNRCFQWDSVQFFLLSVHLSLNFSGNWIRN